MTSMFRTTMLMAGWLTAAPVLADQQGPSSTPLDSLLLGLTLHPFAQGLAVLQGLLSAPAEVEPLHEGVDLREVAAPRLPELLTLQGLLELPTA